MSKEKNLSVSDIAQQLNTGKVSIKFLLKRYSKWLPYELIDGQSLYPSSYIKKIILIQENLDAGILLDDIEKKLDALPDLDVSDPSPDDFLDTLVKSSKNEDIRISNDGVGLLKSLVNDIGEQQKRIAIAHEKRAEAEERKAVAIEKRAGAEEKKAQAMNNIADALQEMNKLRGNNFETMQIAQKAASVISIDEDADFQDENINSQDTIEDIQEDVQLEDIQIDDLSLLIKDEQKDKAPGETITDLDDLSSLINEPKIDESETEESKAGEVEEPKLDKPEDLEEVQLDDLSLLIEESDQTKELDPKLDDLSALIDEKPESKTETEPLDDLSQLLDDSNANRQNSQKELKLDDLSKLIDEPSNQDPPAENMDDLSLLIDKDSSKNDVDETNNDIKIDDLSKLIDSDSKPVDDTPEIKLDISPEEDLGKYKAAVMKIIIELKKDGVNVEETTNRLNKNKIKTLSGKPEWGQKAISQIYKFIESAK